MQLREHARRHTSEIAGILAGGTSWVALVNHSLYATLALVIAGPFIDVFMERGTVSPNLLNLFRAFMLTFFVLQALVAGLHLVGQVLRLCGRS